jgi:hypothetical protein
MVIADGAGLSRAVSFFAARAGYLRAFPQRRGASTRTKNDWLRLTRDDLHHVRVSGLERFDA